MANILKKRISFIIGFWVILIILFLIGHKILSKVILHYQQMPSIETKEAYQLISHYKHSLESYYVKMGRCPSMAEKNQLIPQMSAHQYVKFIRLLADEQTKTCFIAAVMRDDTPSRDVKNQLVTIAYRADQPINKWSCYTSVNNIYTIKACRDRPLPNSFLRALADYERNMK